MRDSGDKRVALRLSSDTMGRGDDALGHRLMETFLNVLAELDPRPQVVVLFNSGVKLACEGSPVLEPLRDLERDGARILSCGTCLDHYELSRSVRVGEASNMVAITEAMFGADLIVPL